MDTILFSALHGIALQYPLIQVFVIVFARLALFLYPLFLLRLASWRRCAMQSLFAFAIAYGTNSVIAMLWYRDRPYQDMPAQPLFDTTYLYDSFPSDHASLAMAIAATIYLCSSRIRGITALAVAFLIGLARIMAGVHYASDVLAGFGIGLTAAVASAFVCQHWFRRHI